MPTSYDPALVDQYMQQGMERMDAQQAAWNDAVAAEQAAIPWTISSSGAIPASKAFMSSGQSYTPTSDRFVYQPGKELPGGEGSYNTTIPEGWLNATTGKISAKKPDDSQILQDAAIGRPDSAIRTGQLLTDGSGNYFDMGGQYLGQFTPAQVEQYFNKTAAINQQMQDQNAASHGGFMNPLTGIGLVLSAGALGGAFGGLGGMFGGGEPLLGAGGMTGAEMASLPAWEGAGSGLAASTGLSGGANVGSSIWDSIDQAIQNFTSSGGAEPFNGSLGGTLGPGSTVPGGLDYAGQLASGQVTAGPSYNLMDTLTTALGGGGSNLSSLSNLTKLLGGSGATGTAGTSGVQGLLKQLLGGGTGTGTGNGLSSLFGGGNSNDYAGVLSALLGAYGSNNAADKYAATMDKAIAASDPFASQRPQYQTQFANMNNGTMNPLDTPWMQNLTNTTIDNTAQRLSAKYGGDVSSLGVKNAITNQVNAANTPVAMDYLKTIGNAAGMNINPSAGQTTAAAAAGNLNNTNATYGNLGVAANSLINGQQPSLLQQLYGAYNNQNGNNSNSSGVSV